MVSVSESLLTESATADHLNKYISIDTKSSPPTPLPRIVRMIHCALAARSRLVPSRVRDSVMTNLRNLLASPEMVGLSSTQSLGSVQVLTLLCLCDDLNHADGLMASEAAWRNAGLASRTAFSVVGSSSGASSSPGLAPEHILNSYPVLSSQSSVQDLGCLYLYG